jgi:ABC-type lipoprotein release transport system permease subunit
VIAWRNLWRNARRTLLTAATIAGGVALLVVFFALEDGMHRQMLRSAVQLGGAHAAVQAHGYQDRKASEQTLPQGERERLQQLLQARGIALATLVPRVFASGLASSADGATGVSIIGVDPEAEAEVSSLDERVVAGRFLRAGDENVAVLGQGVARKLELDQGDKLVLMAQAPGSADIQSVLVRVAGIIETRSEDLDEGGVLLPLPSAQALLGMPGRVHQLALILSDPRAAGRVTGILREASPPELEVLHWEELMPSLRDFIRMDVAGLFIIAIIFFLIIAFLVANTLLMSVLERRREFALLDALGLTPARRFLLVMLEATWIAVLSVTCGAVAGCAGHLFFRQRGLNLSYFAESGWSAAGTAVDHVIYSALTPGRLAIAAGLVFLITIALALLPAWKAATEADAQLLGQT